MNSEPIINDILAYLVVLNHRATITKLPQSDYDKGAHNMMGCLHRVMDFFEDRGWLEVVLLVKRREKLNGKYPVGHPELERATEILSERLFEILQVQDGLKPVAPDHKKFMDALDAEFAKILGENK